MVYFTKETTDFLKKLSENNNTIWFNTNKQLFEECVKTPFHNFVEDIIHELDKSENSLMASAKYCIFRLNRDVRFSEDKSPYKTFVSALISPFGRQNRAYPGLYIQISAEEVRLYSGSHNLTPAQLKAVRQKIYDEPKRFKKIISDKNFVKVFGELIGERNKKIPNPFSELTDQIPQIANKEFYYLTKMPSRMILQDEFKETILDKYSACGELNTFLREGLE
ncbi:MAG: DUF2461 domain-containing protein [Bacteroidetes bacterium]|nr:DUF2461 domain-containing protein [Bacteroidota bacterium]